LPIAGYRDSARAALVAAPSQRRLRPGPATIPTGRAGLAVVRHRTPTRKAG